ncbi:MAG TPA: hypothetical protein VF631_05075 [Allosphingosinicella sp.]|jgi:hypothetical protein|uniref:hypothetical protein n=1 Tax=Allosphingosinicella sp. TaxID=2823234 RepID=UPI002F28DEE5
MFQNAYALFFLAALAGSAVALWALLRAHGREVIAVLRGQTPHLPHTPARPRRARIRSGRRLAFAPVTFSICRI